MATRTVSQQSSTAKRRALITGGAGFIGSHLAEALLEEGYAVTALDNLTTGCLENVEQLVADDDFELVGGDVTDELLVDELVREHDVVFHLAAAVGVKLILADPIESFRTNVLGTESVLRGAARHDTKVLIASTSEVYGKTVATPQSEDDDVLLGPSCYSRWSYAACKMLDEFLGLAYAREGLPVVCFRLFNTVGPRQTGHYGMVVPRLVDAALHGDPLPVHGDGSQSRCFLHVCDAVQAILRLNRSPRAVGQVFNIGSTESVTIADLARRVIAAVGIAGHEEDLIRFMPYEEAYPGGGFEDIRCRQPDTSKIRSLTRWRPRRTLDDILRDVVAERVPALAPAPVALEPSIEMAV
ncbi:MAG: nucleoside-diphosphate-sugar epimerase [Actinomycetia bacterium]|nr:nucleoside-diphosphate-sugar epimerase [Actinomycetes bacterium]